MKQNTRNLYTSYNEADLSRIIEMAWEDRTPFEAIEKLYRVTEHQVIELMRSNLAPKTYKNWRKRVSGRSTKHQITRPSHIHRSHCASQYKIRGNK